MRVAILSRNKGLHSVSRLLDEAKKARIHCDVINPLECQLVVDGRKSCILVGAVELPKYNAVIPRIGASITDYGLAVVRQFETLGVYAVNGAQSIAQSRDKLRSLQVLSRAGLRVPKTVLTRSTRGGLREVVERLEGLPVVLKVLQGTQGLGVMLVHSAVSLGSVLETLHGLEQEVLVQQFLAEGAGRDYRVFVVGEKVIAAMMRTAPKGEFRTNIHRGGQGTLVRLPKSYERAAVRATKILGLQIAGVDLMETPRGPALIEVNSSPGFEGIERATGLNIAAAIMKHVRACTK
ncbi:MAG: hypothetical protein A2X94_04915 [Bdellovibrionales bacterium GWB1_55_8]|nr:MAG: hypothetical protein A2X94_04915 [Bdellovibrionales bacterium GWB1_55_8]